MSVRKPTPPDGDDVQLSAIKPEASESERLRELCDWIGWPVVDGRVPSAND